jgi:hypothetical protein
MFSDTITITINAVDKILNRINQDGYSSEYFLRESTGDFRLKIRNTSYTDKSRSIKVDRHNCELVQTVYPASVDLPNTILKSYFVFEIDANQDIDDAVDTFVGHVAFLTDANMTKMGNWES